MAMLARFLPVLLLVSPGLAADWFVDVNADCQVGDGSSVRPFCTIAEALAVSAPGDNVFVRPGTYPELVTVSQDVRIVGVGGRDVTVVDAQQSGSAMSLNAAHLDLEGITLTGGRAPMGGGMHVTGGSLVARNCAIRGNVADGGAFGAGGGGLRHDGGRLVLEDVVIEDNHALSGVGSTQSGYSGGLFVRSTADVEIRDCTIADNSAWYFGAAQLSASTSLLVEGTTFDGNVTGSACDPTVRIGDAATIRLVNCTAAPSMLGEGFVFSFAGSESAVVDHCTFVGTCAQTLYVYSSSGSTGTVTLRNTVIGGWAGPATYGPGSGAVVSGGHNVIEPAMHPSSGFVDGVNGDLVGVGDLHLAPAADNGGPTVTVLPLLNSPARGNGDPASAVAEDQRGAPRVGGVRDSGAVETSRGTSVAICVSTSNSTGRPGALVVTGDPASNAQALALTAHSLPADALCLFLTSRTASLTVGAGGSSGNLCLGGQVGRFARAGEIGAAGPYGVRALVIDPSDLPQPTGAVAAMAGETWAFQAWHRDAVGGAATSNFTAAAALTFL